MSRLVRFRFLAVLGLLSSLTLSAARARHRPIDRPPHRRRGRGRRCQHNVKIDDPEVFSGTLTTGQTVAMTVSLPAGTYTYYRAIPGHRDAGMFGQLSPMGAP